MKNSQLDKEDSNHVTYQCRENNCWNPKAQGIHIEKSKDDGGDYGESEKVVRTFVGRYWGNSN